jgi:hypothetical protein
VKALTLHAPWAHAVAWLGKDIENRGWRPPASVIGTRIAIHAGASPGDGSEWRAVVRSTKRADAEWVDRMADAMLRFRVSALVATAIIGEPVTASDSPWWIGPIGWPLIDVRRLREPIPMKGRLGLWTLPEGVIL